MALIVGGDPRVAQQHRGLPKPVSSRPILTADAGITDDAIAATLSVGGSTVYRTQRRSVEGSLGLALAEE